MERYSEHICGMFLMRRPNCHTNSLWFSLCPLHLSSRTSPFMSIFTPVYLSSSAMKGLYLCMYLVALLFRTPSFHLRMGRLQPVLVPHCAAVSYFQNTRVSFASDSIPFNSCVFSEAPLAYISLSVHQRADSFFSAFKRTFLFFFLHSSHKPPF